MNPDERREEIQAAAALYALGALTEDEARVFEAEIDQEADAFAEELASFESVVACLGLSGPEQSPATAVREKLLSRVQFQPEKPIEFFSLKAHEGRWDEIAPGVLVKPLFIDREKGTSTVLLKLQPGAKIERHLHPGAEQCYILEGDFWANGQMLGPGDFHVAMPDSIHETITSINGALSLIVRG